MSDAAQKDTWKYRNVVQWKIDSRPYGSSFNVNEVTRRATREPDPVIADDDRNWAMLYAGLGLIAIVIFIGAFEYGLLDFLKPLFI